MQISLTLHLFAHPLCVPCQSFVIPKSGFITIDVRAILCTESSTGELIEDLDPLRGTLFKGILSD